MKSLRQMESLHQKESFSSIITAFIKDLGPHGVLAHILTNGDGEAMEALFREFQLKHPYLDINRGEFEDYVVETIRRTSAALAAETGAIPGSMAGAGIAKMLSLPPDLAGSLAFSGNMMLNFLSFAGVWMKSHHHRFLKPDGKFDTKAFIKSFLREYGEHFGPIAVSADFLEAKVIQYFAGHDFGYVETAGVVTLIGSILAVLVYFYEQQARLKLHQYLEKNGNGRALLQRIEGIRGKFHEILTRKFF